MLKDIQKLGAGNPSYNLVMKKENDKEKVQETEEEEEEEEDDCSSFLS